MQFLLTKAIVLTHHYSPSSLPAEDEASPYSRPRIFLHWLSAAIILWATFSGFGVVLLDTNDPFRQWVESFNPQITSLFIPFFAWRLWLAIKNPSARERNTAQQRVASAAHKAIYAAVFGGVDHRRADDEPSGDADGPHTAATADSLEDGTR